MVAGKRGVVLALTEITQVERVSRNKLLFILTSSSSVSSQLSSITCTSAKELSKVCEQLGRFEPQDGAPP